MGAGGRMTEKELLGRTGAVEIFQRAPSDKPAFTLAEIKKAIPPHCFQRSVIKSFSYVVYDLVMVASLLYAALVWIPALPVMQQLGAWPLYWFAQGCVMTGIWVLAHECGHHAFSDYLLLDNMVGLVLHSCLLVPYFSWKYSHRRHHANTGSMEHDEVYVPKKKEALPWYAPYVYNNPVGRLGYIVVQLTLGWPMYLALNTSGRTYPRFVCHYDPYGPMYSDMERAQVFVSDVGVLAVSFGLLKLASAFGFWWVVRIYGMPLLVVNAWLIVITYLAHTHPALPHYDSTEWEWLRGALATMDRDLGVLNRVFHNSTDTHVAHHLFSSIPHYHAMEATKAIRPVLGDYYQFESNPIARATWRSAKECIYVQPEDPRNGVFWYTNKF